jgi:glyoxylase-like metal-dependent hydrolase (beta-lactamase superfamily II)
VIEHRRREPAPGVFRLILPLPWPGLDRVNAYVLTSGEGATIVDCGINDPGSGGEYGWEAFLEALGALDLSPKDIQRLLVTHPHVDHYGLAGRLVRETGCELSMHAQCGEELSIYRDPDGARHRMAEMLADHGLESGEIEEILSFEDLTAFVSEVVEPTAPVHGGEEYKIGTRTWLVVHTPGHSRSHVCLWSAEDRLLIAGDHLLQTITPHIDFRRGDDDPLGDFLDSLLRIEELDPQLVFPGHGRPFADGAGRARVVARHHDRRLGSILQIIRHEPRTADQITDQLFGSTLLHFQRRLAIGEALAHLAYLRKRGEVERFRDEAGKYRYRKVSRRSDPQEDE